MTLLRAIGGPWCLALAVGGLAVVAGTAPAVAAPTAEPDSVRTNLWLAEALMGDIVAASREALPPPPATVALRELDDKAETELFTGVVVAQLQAAGYDLVQAGADEDAAAMADVNYAYRVLGVELTYPDVGRTLGLWRSWVERDLSVSAALSVTEGTTGRVLLNRRITRSFNDRVPDGDFGAVNSNLYPFTNAEPASSGWQGRLEAIVVLGALAATVAIYFANTSD